MNTTGLATNVVDGAPDVAAGAGWAVGNNAGSQPTIKISFTDTSNNTVTTGSWTLINSSNGGNLK